MFLTRGNNKSSVDDLMDCLASSIESEKLELRRCLRGFDMSAEVEARPRGRRRRGDEGDPILASSSAKAYLDVDVGPCSWDMLRKERINKIFARSLKHLYVTIVSAADSHIAFLGKSKLIRNPISKPRW